MEPFISLITGFASNFAPRSWAFCDGQLLPISSNTALFSLLGTMYGGDGRTTFALPDMRGRAPIGAGRGPGLQVYPQAQKGGVETVTLTVNQMPSHNHNMFADNGDSNRVEVSGGFFARAIDSASSQVAESFTTSAVNTSLSSKTIANQGGNQAHNNMVPYTTINFCIALYGIYPSRS